MIAVGISAYYHESACALLRDGELVAAVSEERLSRKKHDPAAPVRALRYCLEQAEADITDIDVIGYYEDESLKLERKLWAASHGAGRPPFGAMVRSGPEPLRRHLGWDGSLLTFDHHRSHAASAYYFSGFNEAAWMVNDGVGEWATTTLGRARGTELEPIATVEFPHSIGLLYSTITSFLGFEVLSGEYKVMGLAPYGEPRYLEELRKLIVCSSGDRFELDLRFFDYVAGSSMYRPCLADHLGLAPRAPGSEMGQSHRDLARSLQVLLEELLLEKVDHLHQRTGSRRLCMAGGVALNCVANGRIQREGPFDEVFIQPAATDAGGALGAAALAWVERTGTPPRCRRMSHVYLGPGADDGEARRLLVDAGVAFEDHSNDEPRLLEAVVDRLVEGCVVGWFQGRMEFGARALGSRSILADPRRSDMRDRLNRLVKKREAFRPFAPSVLTGESAAHFGHSDPDPFMLTTCGVISPLAAPAITHVDGSARPQTVDRATAPRYAALLDAFHRRTGCPFVVNTSFNIKDEPIVSAPADALRCLVHSGIDCLVLGDLLVDRNQLPGHLVATTVPHHVENVRHDNAIYTFL